MTKLIWGGLLCAACLVGCAQPSGGWMDLNPPVEKTREPTRKPISSVPAGRGSVQDGAGGRDVQGAR